MWQMPDWALDQQRRNSSQAQLAYFQAVWPDLSQVPAGLRVPSLLICGTEDAAHDAMVRAARAGHLTLVTLAGADHMASFLSERARQTYQRFLRDVG
jgi:pimeloyl-ACP methyl ester carboxylesterase